ncbi:hypothetical protein C8D95_101573 [Silicimonas algicola]|uniref:Uncharacterized protein n=1 Tax=Silicimonas algicola TaxID=1826607 RepID=A0A316GCU3_9RHOB|nr:hypothetical protein C8D95_101573 [Silicimonas algicola]
MSGLFAISADAATFSVIACLMFREVLILCRPCDDRDV